MNRLLFTSVFAFLSLFASSALGGAAGTSSAPAASVIRPRPSDPQLEQVLRTKLAKSKIGKDGFKFTVKNGVVTWDGSTGVMQHKGAATRMARTAGAVQVVNNIKVTGNLTGVAKRAEVKTN